MLSNKLFVLLVSKAGCNNDSTSLHAKKKNLVRMKTNISIIGILPECSHLEVLHINTSTNLKIHT